VTRYGAAGKTEEQVRDMSLKDWENKVLGSPGAAGRVAAIEDELRLAAGLTALREKAGLSQRALAKRIGVSQPRVAQSSARRTSRWRSSKDTSMHSAATSRSTSSEALRRSR
jgi:predicted XRE-type DNA-binding protein